MQRRTRIVATLGPATDAPGVLEKLLDAGLDVARINFRMAARRNIGAYRQSSASGGAAPSECRGLGDLPGPKLALFVERVDRAGGWQEGDAGSESASERGHQPDGTGGGGEDQGRPARVARRWPAASARGHGRSRSDHINHEVSGLLLPNKGMNLPDTELSIPAVTKRDREAIAVALQAGVDWLGLSFVRDASAAHELRAIIRSHDANVPILAKIERPEAVKKSAAIIDAFDGIMVARGDLGSRSRSKWCHSAETAHSASTLAGKPVITATDMLDSMRTNPRPTRAEVSDVANAVYDGTDAVMLSGETAIGAWAGRSAVVHESHCAGGGDAPAGKRAAPCRGAARRTDRSHHALPVRIGRGNRRGGDYHADDHRTNRPARRAPSPPARNHRRLQASRSRSAIGGSLGRGRRAFSPSKSTTAKIAWKRPSARSYQQGTLKPGTLVVVLANHPVEGGEGFPTTRVPACGRGRALVRALKTSLFWCREALPNRYRLHYRKNRSSPRKRNVDS